MEQLLTELGVEWERADERSFVVTMPGERKLRTQCRLSVEDHALRLEAFVARRPEENEAGVWKMLLRRNASLYGVSFAVDEVGDVWLLGRTNLAAIDAAELDRLLGSLLTAADETFNRILELGFAASIRREWAWRLSRGESTRNLAAFEHLRPPPEEIPALLGESEAAAPTLRAGEKPT